MTEKKVTNEGQYRPTVRNGKKVQKVIVPSEEEVTSISLVKKVKPFAPLIAALVGLIGVFFTDVLGFDPLPYTVPQIVDAIFYIISVAGIFISWWNNNDVSKKAKQRTSVADQVVKKTNTKR